MKERIITAIFFVIAMILGIFGGEYTFAALVLFIVVMSYIEFFRLSRYEGQGDFRQILALIFGVSPVIFAIIHKLELGLMNWSTMDYAILYIPFLIVFYIQEIFYESKDPIKNLGTIVLSFVYIGIPYMLLVQLAYWEGFYQPFLVFGLFVYLLF